MSSKRPIVSLGLPVYNGENYLAMAIESVLAQTFADFELIITDNASTDGTQAICEHYAAMDSRIRYHRNQMNLGAAPNFNLAFDLSRGRYFKWVAHDDLMATEFLEQCITIMEEDSSIALCFSDVLIIDENGHQIDTYEITLDTNTPMAGRRYRSLLLDWHMCFDVFGLIRSEALRQTPRMPNYGHGDGVLLARLSLLGRFHKIDAYLFQARRHPEQSMLQFSYDLYRGGLDYRAYAEWFDQSKRGMLLMPQWRILAGYYIAIWQTPIHRATKLRCHMHILRWIVRNRTQLWGDLIFVTNFTLSSLGSRKFRSAEHQLNAKSI